MSTRHASPASSERREGMNRLALIVASFERITAPKLYGVERIPERGALFVGNHTLFGVIDVPFMGAQLWRRRGIRLRGLGDHGHYRIPVWRDLLERSGMVRGTRENVRALMRDGQHVLVFPGGTGEVFHGRGEKYQLLWKERLGVRAVGDRVRLPDRPVRRRGRRGDVRHYRRPPDTRECAGVGEHEAAGRHAGAADRPRRRADPILRPERLYFWFGEPIDTARFDGRAEDDDAARRVRNEVRMAVQSGIEFLSAEREADPRRGVTRRVLHLPAPPVADPDAHFVARAFDAMNEAGGRNRGRLDVALDQARGSTRLDRRRRPARPGRVIARLDQVIAELGAVHVDVEDARSVGRACWLASH